MPSSTNDILSNNDMSTSSSTTSICSSRASRILKGAWQNKLKLFLDNYWYVLLVCPPLLLYVYSNDLKYVSVNSLIYRRTCLAEFNQTLCDHLNSTQHQNETNHIQELAADIGIYMNVIFLLPAIVSILILSSYGDKKLSYRLPLLISTFGSLVDAVMCLLASSVDSYSQCILLLYVGQFLNGALGAGSLCFISSCFSHISMHEHMALSERVTALRNQNYEYSNADDAADNDAADLMVKQTPATSKYRSIRYSLCESCLLIAQFSSSLSSGYLIGNKRQMINFQRVYAISLAIFMIVMIYILFMYAYLVRRQRNTLSSADVSLNVSRQLNENDIDNNDSSVTPDMASTSSILAPSLSSTNEQSTFKPYRLFKTYIVDRLADNYELLKRQRPNNARFHVAAMLIMYFLGASISLGIMQLQYLYLVKEPLAFLQTEYGLFRALNTLFRSISLLVLLPLFKYFSIADSTLNVLGLTSEFLNLVVFSATYYLKSIIWLAPIVYMFSNYYIVCIRSFASKLVEKQETGKFFGIIAVIEFLVLLISSTFFSFTYKKSVSFYPPLTFLIGCAICLLCYPFLIYIFVDFKRNNQNSRLDR